MLQWKFFRITHFNQGNRFSQGSQKFPKKITHLWESHLFSWINPFRYKGFCQTNGRIYECLEAPIPSTLTLYMHHCLFQVGCCLEEINFVARLSWLFSVVVQKRWDISKCEEIWRILSWSFVNCLQFTTTSFINCCMIYYITIKLP